MTTKDTIDRPKEAARARREARLAEALRANLKRRKSACKPAKATRSMAAKQSPDSN
jgi:hypothetical protein